MWKRDIQGKFALKEDNYRQVRSLRVTDETWKALGIAAECFGTTRADYLEQVIKDNPSPSITWTLEPIDQAQTTASRLMMRLSFQKPWQDGDCMSPTPRPLD